ncbi:MAG: hypothetical protein WDM85_02840 [Caulobacteraceae bacterium]
MARPGQPNQAGLIADLAALGGAGAMIVDLPGDGAPLSSGAGAVRIGVHRAGDLPIRGLDDFDILLSTDPSAPWPWVGLPPDRLEATLDVLAAKSGRSRSRPG